MLNLKFYNSTDCIIIIHPSYCIYHRVSIFCSVSSTLYSLCSLFIIIYSMYNLFSILSPLSFVLCSLSSTVFCLLLYNSSFVLYNNHLVSVLSALSFILYRYHLYKLIVIVEYTDDHTTKLAFVCFLF